MHEILAFFKPHQKMDKAMLLGPQMT